LNYGIAVVVCIASSAEAGPEGVPIGRSGDERAGDFVEYRKLSVDPLYILRGADRSVGIGRGQFNIKSVLSLTQAVNIQAQVGSDWRQNDLLQGNVGRGILRPVTGGASGEDFQQTRRKAVGLGRSHPIQFGERRGDIVFQFVDYTDSSLFWVLGRGGDRTEERQSRG
jgi:hypothetical protein